jgi:hypothetical protein
MYPSVKAPPRPSLLLSIEVLILDLLFGESFALLGEEGSDGIGE